MTHPLLVGWYWARSGAQVTEPEESPRVFMKSQPKANIFPSCDTTPMQFWSACAALNRKLLHARLRYNVVFALAPPSVQGFIERELCRLT